jgi:hypothetical protein
VVSAYDGDARVTWDGNAYVVTVPYGTSAQEGRVERVGREWRSFWTGREPLVKWHTDPDEAIRLFIGDPR